VGLGVSDLPPTVATVTVAWTSPPPRERGAAGRGARQGTFDDLGVPLSELTFVVVDLETTGGSPVDCGITEIGAVKVRGGERLGEFHTLVNPGQPIPPFIAVLTGITDAGVAGSPRIEAVLPGFLEFARGAVLVAHNAPFDVGFLRAAAQRQDLPWPRFDVVDTARLARRTLTKDEAPNCRLATLARLFHATTTPSHRALDDARATVDVLHGLFERLGCFGVTTWEDVATFSTRVSPAQQRKRHLAQNVPRGPGVYLFRDARQRVLYVGKSVDMRARVRQYFTAAEQRKRMAEMVAVAEEVVAIACPTLLEAEVRELRLIAEHKPPYNRRSKFPERAAFVKLTVEAFPRLSTVRKVRADDHQSTVYLGPIGSARSAELATAALHEAVQLRQCSGRLPVRPRDSACVLAEIGRCGAPCVGGETVEQYAGHVAAAASAITNDAAVVVAAATARIDALVEDQRYEQAATVRDRMLAFLRAAARGQRLRAFTRCPLVVAARPTTDHGWEVVVVRHGRLGATGTVPPGADPWPTVHGLVAAGASESAADVSEQADRPGPTPAATAEETECLLRWLDAPEVRLVLLDGTWASPARGAQGTLERLAPAAGFGVASATGFPQ
jgi:DNA polymerase-3 subunit epsilon